MTDSSPESDFLNVPALLAHSQPRPRPSWIIYALAATIGLVLLNAVSDRAPERYQHMVDIGTSILTIVLIGGGAFLGWRMAQRARTAQRDLEAVEEMIQLRRWADAAQALDNMLSRPTRSPQFRIQGLIFLAAVLARYHRYTDAANVYDYILSTTRMDDESAHGLKLGRAMALLHDERLFDVDHAIIDLRRGPRGPQSGGLALVEIYRDVKTGHAEEAIAIFNERLLQMRNDLGLRLGDAYALAARAFDLLGRPDEAQRAWESATLLASEAELSRRYPEVAPLVGKYAATPRPAEAA